MRAYLCKLSALACLSFCLTACQPASAPKIISAGDRTPVPVATKTIPTPQRVEDVKTLGWKPQKGARKTLADYKGKVVILDFWATYCPPCLEEIPHLVDLQNKYKDKGLRVVGLNVGGDDDRPLVPGYVKKLKMQYDLGEPEPELVDALFNGSDLIPQTFIFDRSGKLVKNFSSYSEQVGGELDKAVETALAN
jgi:thiol-disulfide isomerase/thioredoxin